MDKFSELKAAAMAATPGPWEINRAGNTIVSNQSHPVATLSDAFHRQLADGGVGKDAEFIASANPATVLELLAELEAKDKRIAELGGVCSDASQVFKEIGTELGCNPDNESIMMAIDALKERLATPVRLKKVDSSNVPFAGDGFNAAVDYCAAGVRAAGFSVTVEGDE
ncbi:TPA: ead/Ea22-like family protein [Serratia marcescens]